MFNITSEEIYTLLKIYEGHRGDGDIAETAAKFAEAGLESRQAVTAAIFASRAAKNDEQ